MNRNIIFKLLVVFILLTLSSCDKNKIYYPADFYQGTLQTCIDKNNIYADFARQFSHVNENAMYFFDQATPDYLIEYDFSKNKLDTLYSPMSSNLSPGYYPTDFYMVNRDSMLIVTTYRHYWNTNNVYLPFKKINNFIDDSVYYYCYGGIMFYEQMNIIDGKYLIAPVMKYCLKNQKSCQLINEWQSEYDSNKDWNRKHYVRFNITNDTTVSEVKLIADGSWISSHPTDVYYNNSLDMGNIYCPTKERIYFFTQHTMEIAVADKEGNYIESVTPESQFFIPHPPFSVEDTYSTSKSMKYAKNITLISKLIYDEYRDVFLRVMFLPVIMSKDGMQEMPRDFVVMVLNKNLKKKYEVYFSRENYLGSLHVTKKGVYILKTDKDEKNGYYKADRFIFD